MTSKTIVQYYELLERKDADGSGDSSIFDDGSEALYCLLFKLMGDKRSIETLSTEWIDWPTASALVNAAETGDYSDLLSQMSDHDCGLSENCDVVDVSDVTIETLEKFIPMLVTQVKSGKLAKDVDFLNEAWLACS